MSRVFRSTVKGLASKLLGHADVRGFVRTRKLWLSRRIYRRPVEPAELRQKLIELGVTRGRTVWVQSSWNEFYNVPLRPSEMIDLLRDLLGPEGTLAMPAFPIDQDPSTRSSWSIVRRSTPACCARCFAGLPGVLRSIHLGFVGLRDRAAGRFPGKGSSPRENGLGAGQPVLPADGAGCPAARPWRRLRIHDSAARRRMPAAMTRCPSSAACSTARSAIAGSAPTARPASTNICSRIGDIRPPRLRRHFGPDILREAQNLEFEDDCRGC